MSTEAVPRAAVSSAAPAPVMLPRREWLTRASAGFGMAAWAGLCAAESPRPAAAIAAAPRARRVILLFMSGGVSQVDSFDPKPLLAARAGQPLPGRIDRTQFNNVGTLMPSLWDFRPRGECGTEISELFPGIARHADKLAVVRSMTAKFSEHAQGNLFLHTGFPFLGNPSAGAWAVYGLGRECEELPGYVVLKSGDAGIPHGGVACFSNGFLPSDCGASLLACDADPAVRDIRPWESGGPQRRRLDFIARQNRRFGAATDAAAAMEAAIRTHETAFRMQAAVPALTDISGETAATRAAYGLDAAEPKQAAFARQCLLARRLVERGVRFVELSCLAYNIGGGNGANPWDHHGEIRAGHERMARQVDQPIAALLADLADRGLLDETLVVWVGEFGRTPFSQGGSGRDHDPYGFSMWLAGGGVKGGTVLGATDEFGYRAVEDVVTLYDLWATVLHCLGVDHENLTFRHGGRDMRLTDVHGHVMRKILA